MPLISKLLSRCERFTDYGVADTDKVGYQPYPVFENPWDVSTRHVLPNTLATTLLFLDVTDPPPVFAAQTCAAPP
jgi:hypothetical protein